MTGYDKETNLATLAFIIVVLNRTPTVTWARYRTCFYLNKILSIFLFSNISNYIFVMSMWGEKCQLFG